MNSISFDFSGTAVLVTGGTSGIGHAIAQALLEQGTKVMIGDIHEAELAEATKCLAEFGDADGLLCDVADPAAVQRSISSGSSSARGVRVSTAGGCGACARGAPSLRCCLWTGCCGRAATLAGARWSARLATRSPRRPSVWEQAAERVARGGGGGRLRSRLGTSPQVH